MASPCNPTLPVGPHRRAIPPAALQPQQLIGVGQPFDGGDGGGEIEDQACEIVAVATEVDGLAIGSPIMLSGKEIRKRLQTPVQMGVVTVGRIDREMASLNCSPR